MLYFELVNIIFDNPAVSTPRCKKFNEFDGVGFLDGSLNGIGC